MITELTKKQQADREYYAKNAEKIREQKRQQYKPKRTTKMTSIIGAEISQTKEKVDPKPEPVKLPKPTAEQSLSAQPRQQSPRERIENRLAERELQRQLSGFI